MVSQEDGSETVSQDQEDGSDSLNTPTLPTVSLEDGSENISKINSDITDASASGGDPGDDHGGGQGESEGSSSEEDEESEKEESEEPNNEEEESNKDEVSFGDPDYTDSEDVDLDEKESTEDDKFLFAKRYPVRASRTPGTAKQTRNQQRLLYRKQGVARMKSPGLFPKPSRKKNKKTKTKPTDEEIKLWKNESVQAMAKATNATDILSSYMILGYSGRFKTAWQGEMSMFFMLAFVIGTNPYNLILGFEATARQNILSLEAIKQGGAGKSWTLPRIPNMNDHLTTVSRDIHDEIKQRWDATKDRIEAQFTYDGVKTVIIPECPPWDDFKQQIYKGHRHMWKIWWGHKESCTRDVRKDVIEWATLNLLPLENSKDFVKAIDVHWQEGLKHHKKNYLRIHNQSTLEDSIEPGGKGGGKPGGKGGGKGQGKPKDKNKPSEKKKPAENEDNGKKDDVKDKNKPAEKTKQKKKIAEKKKPSDNNDEDDAKKDDDDATTSPANKRQPTSDPSDSPAEKKAKLQFLKQQSDFKLFAKKQSEKEHTDNVRIKVTAIHESDPVLTLYLEQWMCLLQESPDVDKETRVRNMDLAMDGLLRLDPKEIWKEYHHAAGDDDTTIDLDGPKREKRGSVDYLRPSPDFVLMAEDIMNVMNLTLRECEATGLRVIRYQWEYQLMKGIQQLTEENFDPQKRLRAMYATLVLSAATSDFGAINGGIKLCQAGLLDSVDAIAEASLEDIRECIKECGIHNRRAVYLKEGFKVIRKDHNGMVPASMDALTSLPGVGRKTATLLLNEGFGFYAGIGTDKHVCNVSLALGLFNKTHGLKNAAPDHVEASLRQWIHQRNFRNTNQVFGGMAQLITQDLATISTEEEHNGLKLLLSAIAKRFHTPYEIELIWFIIGKIRAHYKVVVEKRMIAMKMDQEESGDEVEEDEVDEMVQEDG